MLATKAANEFARQWIAAWNAHDLDLINSHYSDDVVFSSPFVKRIGADDSGSLRGRAALLEYFRAALAKFPVLSFQLRSVFIGIDTVTIVFDIVNGFLAAETMALSDTGKITRVWAQYDRFE